jgi:hypothetical protein
VKIVALLNGLVGLPVHLVQISKFIKIELDKIISTAIVMILLKAKNVKFLHVLVLMVMIVLVLYLNGPAGHHAQNLVV